MDYDKLIEDFKQLEFVAYNYNINGEVFGMDCTDFENIMADAATAIETLLVENQALRNAANGFKAALARVTAERDAAVSWAQKFTESIDKPCAACKHNTGDYVCTAICGNCGPMGSESCKWEFDFSGELKED